jgi:phosphohistidine phosphatase
MRLLVVRHAIAEDRETFQGDDAARPLTAEGRKKMKRGAEGLKQLVPDIDLLASSPLKRALETAEIIAREYQGLKVQRVPQLAPATPPEQVIAWLTGLPEKGTVALAGHEPDLSHMVCSLLTSTGGPFLEFRKGGACLLEFAGAVGPGTGTLDWLLGPKHLRQLGADCG